MDQAAFIARVANRMNMSSDDPHYSNLDEWVDDAIHEIETWAPDGWPWLTTTLTLTTTASTGEYTFSTLGALTTPSITINKVKDAKILNTANVYDPLDLMSPTEAEIRYPSTSTGFPDGWYVEGQVLFLYPTPDSAYTVKIRVIRTEPDLGAANSSPLLPTVYHVAVVDTALMFAYQALGDINRFNAQQARLQDWVQRLRRHGNEYEAAPRITVREPLVRW